MLPDGHLQLACAQIRPTGAHHGRPVLAAQRYMAGAPICKMCQLLQATLVSLPDNEEHLWSGPKLRETHAGARTLHMQVLWPCNHSPALPARLIPSMSLWSRACVAYPGSE